MNKENIEKLYELMNETDHSELALTYAYIDDEDEMCRVAMYGDDEELTAMALSVLLEVYTELDDGVKIEEFAESVKQELVKFFWEQGTEE